MPNTESEVIQTILKNGGKAKKRDIVKKLGVSLGYFDIITRSLERRGLIKLSNNVYFLTSSGKKKLTEFIPKKVKTFKLEIKPPSRAGTEGKKRGRPKKQKTEEFKNNNDEPKAELTQQTPYQFVAGQAEELPKESPVETLLEQRVDELKEGVAEAEKKIEESLENIEKKIEKELEKKIKTVEEKVKPAVEKIEELPPIILQFGKFLFSTSKKLFDKFKKVKNVKFPKSPTLFARQNTDEKKQVSRVKASLIFAKLRDFKVRNKLISLPTWISRNYKNLTKKK